MASAGKSVLGRGLASLIPREQRPATEGSNARQDDNQSVDVVVMIDLNRIERNPYQPRTEFDPTSLQDLTNSILEKGIIQPVTVRRITEGYQLISGERRVRAAREAGLKQVPAFVIRVKDDEEMLELALIENLQRENLNPIEESRGYNELIQRFGLKQDDVAQKVGKSRAVVANALRLLSLPEEVQSWVAKGQLSVGHAKVILGLTIPEEQRLIAEQCLRQSLTVRQVEKIVEKAKDTGRVPGKRKRANRASHYETIEDGLRQKLGTKVIIVKGRRKGRIEIEFFGDDDLSRLIALLGFDKF
jgi:ParB family chromosome partitioning protein